MKIRQRLLRGLLSVHKVLGTVMSLFLLMWFISGMVMMYHDMPWIADKELPHLTTLPASAGDSLMVMQRDTALQTVHSLTLSSYHGHPVYRVRTDESLKLDAYTLKPIDGTTTLDTAREVALRWYPEIVEEREIHELEAFIPLSSYREHFPIYRFTLGDPDRTIIYVSGVTGEVVQATTRMERFWSWIGPIPHYLYFWQLRQYRDAWISVVTWIGAIGAVMCLSGIVLGLVMYLKVYRRTRKWRTPYRKPFYLRWHHILGLFFGLFMFTFTLSGVYSLNSLPKWMVGKSDRDLTLSLMKGNDIEVTPTLQAEIQAILRSDTDSIKVITVSQLGEDRFYKVGYSFGYKYMEVDEAGRVSEHMMTEEELHSYLDERTNAPYEIELITKYDSQYTSGKTEKKELPVYKVKIQDADDNLLYLAPKSGNMRVFSTASRNQSWLYPKLHSFRFAYLSNHPLLRQILLWTLLLGGAAVSLTGVRLGIRYLIRTFRRKKR